MRKPTHLLTRCYASSAINLIIINIFQIPGNVAGTEQHKTQNHEKINPDSCFDTDRFRHKSNGR